MHGQTLFQDVIVSKEIFFHSARWNHNVDLRDKDVIVMGTGCSAAQFVPLLPKEPYKAKSITQVMRSPPWVVPRPGPFLGLVKDDSWEKWTSRLFPIIPGLGRAYRTLLFCLAEVEYFLIFTSKNGGSEILQGSRSTPDSAYEACRAGAVP